MNIVTEGSGSHAVAQAFADPRREWAGIITRIMDHLHWNGAPQKVRIGRVSGTPKQMLVMLDVNLSIASPLERADGAVLLFVFLRNEPVA